jgi:hypothetical protein
MDSLHRRLAPLAAFGGSLLLSGCFAASITTHVAEPIRPLQSADVAVLAVMPVLSEAGSEWMRPQTMDRLVRGLQRRFPGIQVLDPETSGARLADQSYAREYASILADFEQAGVVDPVRIEDLLNVLEATHFLHVRADFFVSGEQHVDTDLLGDGIEYTTRHQSGSLVARLWDASSSTPRWEAVVRSESQRGPFTRHRKPEEMVESIVTALVENVPLTGAVTADAQN